MEENKNKEGISVKELEGFVKKYRCEVFLVAMFVLACIFGLGLIWSPYWSVLFAALGGVIGAILPQMVVRVSTSMLGFVLKQDQNTQLILAGVILVLSILVCPLVFLLMGLHAGKTLHLAIKEISSQGK